MIAQIDKTGMIYWFLMITQFDKTGMNYWFLMITQSYKTGMNYWFLMITQFDNTYDYIIWQSWYDLVFLERLDFSNILAIYIGLIRFSIMNPQIQDHQLWKPPGEFRLGTNAGF